MRTHAAHGIMLPALVSHRGSDDEGTGCYELAAELGKMPVQPTPDRKLQAVARLTHEMHQHYAR